MKQKDIYKFAATILQYDVAVILKYDVTSCENQALQKLQYLIEHHKTRINCFRKSTVILRVLGVQWKYTLNANFSFYWPFKLQKRRFPSLFSAYKPVICKLSVVNSILKWILFDCLYLLELYITVVLAILTILWRHMSERTHVSNLLPTYPCRWNLRMIRQLRDWEVHLWHCESE